MKRDERIVRLAENVVNYSVGVQKGERIYVECFGASAQPLFEEVIAAVTRAVLLLQRQCLYPRFSAQCGRGAD